MAGLNHEFKYMKSYVFPKFSSIIQVMNSELEIKKISCQIHHCEFMVRN